MLRHSALLLLAALVASCGGGTDDGLVRVAHMGDAASLYATGPELSSGAQLLHAAQQQGLVRFNEAGEIVPGLAERWIVTDDGRSYIFRITEFDLPDGTRLTARAVADGLEKSIARVKGTSLALDLAKISEVRVMTGRVIEIRLRSPMPGFLHLIAQPELGVALAEGNAGPMLAEREGDATILAPIPPELRGQPQRSDWLELVDRVQLAPYAPRDAAQAFEKGQVDLLLGGRLETLPLAITGALSRGTVRLDSAIGLFGLDVLRPEGFLASPANREALALAIDRPTLVEQFNLSGWTGSNRIVGAAMPGDDGSVGERWTGLSLDQRRAEAASRVRQWQAESGSAPTVSVYLPEGPGSDYLFAALAEDLASVGVALLRAADRDLADLALRDSVARYAGARWFLNQFNCAFAAPVCSADADYLVELSLDAADAAEEASYLAEAEQTLTATNLYIPLGTPIRWSQARAGVEGFSENGWAVHPLFPLSKAPI